MRAHRARSESRLCCGVPIPTSWQPMSKSRPPPSGAASEPGDGIGDSISNQLGGRMTTSTAPPDRTRTGKAYLADLADGRRVHLAGLLVEDLAHHPATEGMAGFLADLLDAHHP